jgi:methylglutaconyl-CoA hydratase
VSAHTKGFGGAGGSGGVTELRRIPLQPAAGDEHVAVLALNRPEAANSFNDAVIRELVAHLKELKETPACRALVLRGKGRHFSAGADLGWMKASAQLGYDDNIRDAKGLIDLFESLANLPMPTLAVVTGSAFGGAVGLTACCDVAIAAESARFCLSEIKLGIIPAVILPYLARKMAPGQLRRHALTGRIFDAREAERFGLVQRVAPDAELEAAVREEVNGVLAGAPTAQAAVKVLHQRIVRESLAQGPHTAEAIAALRVAPAAQAGFAAFFAKQPVPWARTLGADPVLGGSDG